MNGPDDENLRLFENFAAHDLHEELFPKLVEISEILENYLKQFENTWQPNVSICQTTLDDLKNRCLKVKKDVKIAKIFGSSVTLTSGVVIIGSAIASFAFPPLIIPALVAGGVAMGVGVGGAATHIISSQVEHSSDKDIAKKVNETLDKHLENNRILNDIMLDFDEKYKSLLEYFDRLGLTDQVLQNTIGLSDFNAFGTLKAHIADFKTKCSDSKDKLEKPVEYKCSYTKAVKVLVKYIKMIYEKLENNAHILFNRVTALMGTLPIPPTYLGLRGTNVLNVASKVGLGVGIAFNAVVIGLSIYDIVTEATNDCNKDKLIIDIKSLQKAIRSEAKIFLDHQKEVKDLKNKLEEIERFL